MPRHLAMGMIETRGLVGAIEAADAAAKTAEIYLIRKEHVDAGLVTVHFVGETSAVQEATRVAAERAAKVGQLVASHVIPRLDEMTARMLGVPLDDADPYELMTVDELRDLARGTPGFPGKGRTLMRMTKEQLVAGLLKAAAKGKGHA